MLNKFLHKSPWLLLCFVACLIVYHILGYLGHFGYDDLHYARIASDLIHGKIDYNDHFTFRTPAILLTALSYWLFGISDLASSLPAMAVTILILAMVYTQLKAYPVGTRLIALSLTAFSPWFMFYSDKLMPDMYLAFSVVAAITVIHRYKFNNTKNKPRRYGLWLALALMFGFMAKGTVVLLLPLLVYYVLSDLIRKQNLAFWKSALLWGVLLLTAYFLATYLLTGNAMQRFLALFGNSYLGACSYDQQPVSILLERIGSGFFSMIIYQYMALGVACVLAALLSGRTLKFFGLSDPFSFFLATAFVLFLSCNFMSISPSSYSPMCLDPRHYLFLIPVSAVPAAMIIWRFAQNKTAQWALIIALSILAGLSFYTPGNTFLYYYLPLAILFVLYAFLKPTPRVRYTFLGLFIAVLMIPVIQNIRYARNIDFEKQQQVFRKHIEMIDTPAIIVCDDVQKRLGEYYTGFTPGPLTFINYEQLNTDSILGRKVILVMNWYTRYLAQQDLHDLPYYVRNISPRNRLLYENENLHMAIYEMTRFSIPEQQGKCLLQSRNTFDRPQPYWNQGEGDILNQPGYGENPVNRVREYSATFECSLDSLSYDSTKHVFIQSRLDCFFTGPTESKLVLAIDDSSGTYIWESMLIDKYLKAYANWWPVKWEVKIPVHKIKPGSQLKIFLWNLDEQEARIDNFEVTIYGVKE